MTMFLVPRCLFSRKGKSVQFASFAARRLDLHETATAHGDFVQAKQKMEAQDKSQEKSLKARVPKFDCRCRFKKYDCQKHNSSFRMLMLRFIDTCASQAHYYPGLLLQNAAPEKHSINSNHEKYHLQFATGT